MPLYAQPELYDSDPRDFLKRDRAFYLSMPHSGEKVLELGCGTGRITIPLTMQGCRVTGVDSEPRMLERLKSHNKHLQMQGELTLIQTDLLTLKLVDRFDWIICPFNTFQHMITNHDQRRFFTVVAAHLKNTGRFVFDLRVLTPDIILDLCSEWREDYVGKLSNGDVVTRSHRDVTLHRINEGLVEKEFLYRVTSKTKSQEYRTILWSRYITVTRLKELIDESKLQIEALYGDFDRTQYDGGTRLIACLHFKPKSRGHNE